MSYGFCNICKVKCLNRCAICKNVYYCSKQHQQSHWPQHKLECRKEINQTSNKDKEKNFNQLINSTEAYKQFDSYIANDKTGAFIISASYRQQIQDLNVYFEDTNIQGLTIIHNFLTEEEHDNLASIALESRQEYTTEDSLTGKERVEDPYDHIKVTQPFIPTLGMYFYCKNIVNRLIQKNLVPSFPHQLTINYYEPQEGLLPHTDNTNVIKEYVVGISLLSSCVITFSRNSNNYTKEQSDEEEHNYFLHPGSIMIQRGEVRYNWKHGIKASPSHFQYIRNISVQRSYRISLQLSDFIPIYFERPEIQKLRII